MNVIYLLLAISISVALVFFVLFVLSVRRGQFDDAYTPSVRMLFDDEPAKSATGNAGGAAGEAGSARAKEEVLTKKPSN